MESAADPKERGTKMYPTPLGVSGALLIGVAGSWGTRAVVKRSPMLLLRNQ